jgi:hypothetical protein
VRAEAITREARTASEHIVAVAFVLLAIGVLESVGCAPEVGSPAWCERMDAKPKGDWTANEAADYARHCLLD